MARIKLLLFLLGALISLASAHVPVFCKCTCFKNSTVVPLDDIEAKPPTSDLLARELASANSESDTDYEHIYASAALLATTPAISSPLQRRVPPPSCSRCTKAFCLNQGIDFCKTAKETDVQTMCFQRDSKKDKAIIWGFLLGTSGLLGWAAYKHYREAKNKKAADSSFVPSRDTYARIGTIDSHP